MDTRRDFIKKAALLSGASGVLGSLPAAIQQALAIDPEPGTTCFDAEHVVILMQENRSFDHAYGTLRGVRGFNDPRAITLPSGHPVWLQANAQGETYAPFRLDIKETKATWMGSLPHSWTNQVDARNHGKYDKWLEAKPSGHKEYAGMPLTMGYYSREDIPFYYALADAFTICDQHFCSSLTGTMPNRLYLWTGTIRGVSNASAPAKVLNEDVEYESSASWMTFPERLEDNGLSWKIYQNELYLDVGMTGEEAAWLSNFGDNPLEWFTQYHARFLPAYRQQLNALLLSLPKEIETLKTKLAALPSNSPDLKAIQRKLEKAEASLTAVRTRHAQWTPENFEKLSAREKNLYAKAFSTNTGDPYYHELATVKYREEGKEREMRVPRGDVLHQFRRDVENGQLPAVSWIVAPENFSDHPSSAWFGSWYLSEVMEILTRNPKVWKKTIFMLTYDENDGYFDHVPPFVAPHPNKSHSGLVSKGMSVEEDYVTLQEELKRKSVKEARESSIGLGYRVPLLIASPWSRGGYVCSQVFDHTSVLQFLEKFAGHKAGKKIEETNISAWRRTVCGDLTSAFRPFRNEAVPIPAPVPKKRFLEQIHQAQFKGIPNGYKALTKEEVDQIKTRPHSSPWMPKQEEGTRPSCALPYQIYAEGKLNKAKKAFEITFAAKNDIFGQATAGAPFTVQAPGKYLAPDNAKDSASKWEISRNWAFAAAAGSAVDYEWPLNEFENGTYHLRVYGPNGFFRDYAGTGNDPLLEIHCDYQRIGNQPTGNVELILINADARQAISLEIEDNAYKAAKRRVNVPANSRQTVVLDLKRSGGWYDFSVKAGNQAGAFDWRYAGRVETGKASISDPAMSKA